MRVKVHLNGKSEGKPSTGRRAVLRPCPFCGRDQAKVVAERRAYVVCLACGAQGPEEADPERAAWRWNYRGQELEERVQAALSVLSLEDSPYGEEVIAPVLRERPWLALALPVAVGAIREEVPEARFSLEPREEGLVLWVVMEENPDFKAVDRAVRRYREEAQELGALLDDLAIWTDPPF